MIMISSENWILIWLKELDLYRVKILTSKLKQEEQINKRGDFSKLFFCKNKVEWTPKLK